MKPAGIILTFMGREDWIGKTWWIKLRTLFFNCKLFVFQLMFMVIATAYGKIEWPGKSSIPKKIVAVFITVNSLVGIPCAIHYHNYWALPIFVIYILFAVTLYRGIDWRRVWRAAQCSHVRLCLGESGLKSSKEWANIHKGNVHVLDPDGWDRSNFTESWNEKITEAEFKRRCSYSTCEWNEKGFYGSDSQQISTYDYINFGWELAEIQQWNIGQCDGKHFEYRDPTFPTPPEFMEPVIQYAEDQVGKQYDEVQLASPVVNLPLWMFYPPCWGQEKIKAFNRPGGLEYCVSGVVADLRWGESRVDERGIRQNIRALHKTSFALVGRESEEMTDEYINLLKRTFTKYFPGYDPAVIPPCLVELDENWRRDEKRH